MEAADRKKFVANYTKLLTTAWTEDGFASKLKSDPMPILKEYGFDVPAGSTVDIRTEVEGDGNLDDQIRIWEEGASSGVYKLWVTEEPQYTEGELSESDLESVVGGGDSCCCTCTPSCSCT